jgi:hypothetical protein
MKRSSFSAPHRQLLRSPPRPQSEASGRVRVRPSQPPSTWRRREPDLIAAHGPPADRPQTAATDGHQRTTTVKPAIRKDQLKGLRDSLFAACPRQDSNLRTRLRRVIRCSRRRGRGTASRRSGTTVARRLQPAEQSGWCGRVRCSILRGSALQRLDTTSVGGWWCVDTGGGPLSSTGALGCHAVAKSARPCCGCRVPTRVWSFVLLTIRQSTDSCSFRRRSLHRDRGLPERDGAAPD